MVTIGHARPANNSVGSLGWRMATWQGRIEDGGHNVVFDFAYPTNGCDTSWNAVPIALDDFVITERADLRRRSGSAVP